MLLPGHREGLVGPDYTKMIRKNYQASSNGCRLVPKAWGAWTTGQRGMM
jgi:hypothetical protein